MSNIQKVEFEALKVSGENYLEWALDTKISLNSKGLGEYIQADNKASDKDRSQAIFHIRHHLAASLKHQYLTLENPLELWVALKKRYDHQKMVLLPQAKFDWKELRFQDYKSVNDYNSELFRIVSIMKLCGEKVFDNDLLEKTLSTFHTQNIVLQQQYRTMKHTLYEDLLSCLLLAEKNNELLMRNSARGLRDRLQYQIPTKNPTMSNETDPQIVAVDVESVDAEMDVATDITSVMVPVRAVISLNQTALPTQPISLPAPDAECSITEQRTVVLPNLYQKHGKHLLKLT